MQLAQTPARLIPRHNMSHLINFLASWAHIRNFQVQGWTFGPGTAVRCRNGGRMDTCSDATIGSVETLTHNRQPPNWLAVLFDEALRPDGQLRNMPELFASYATGT